MKHIYPAYKLDELYESHKQKYNTLVKRMKEVRSEYPGEKNPELKDAVYLNLLNELKDSQYKLDEEYDIVLQKYKSLFSEYYITIEELQVILDIDKLYIERHILPNVRTLYLNRHIRRYIKSCHRNKMQCDLDPIIRHYEVDYEKKVFINKKDLEEWMFNHFESEDLLITDMIIKYCLQDRKKAAMHSTETIKKKYGLKYNMQLQRLELDRIYIRAVEDKKPLSRIPSDHLLLFIMS